MLNKKVLIKTTASILSIGTLKVIESSIGLPIPIYAYIVPPIVSILAIEEIFKSWFLQNKRSSIISAIRHITENYKTSSKLPAYILNVSIVTTILYIYAHLINNICIDGNKILPDLNNLTYCFVPVIAYILTIGQSIYTNHQIINKAQYKADNTQKGLNIIDMLKDKTIVTSNKYLSVADLKTLETIVNHGISSIVQDENVKNKYHLYKGNNDYRKLEKSSIARLTQILTNYKDKPEFINSSETETETIIQFISVLPPKRLIRLQDDICHKLGLNKNKLSIDTKDGYTFFRINKDITKTYILDEIIPNISIDSKKSLGFILGVNLNNSNIVIEDLVKLKHLLIAGKTGSGKSCTFKCIIESLMYFNTNIVWYMLDFADSALVRYEDFYNVNYIESETPSIQSALNELIEEYTKRKDLLRNMKVENIQEYNKINGSQLPYIIFAVDEANAFKSEMDKKEFEPMEKQIKTLLQRGRKYGMFCIMAVQQTNDNDFVKSWKTQFTRIAHLLEDTIDCCNITTKKEYQQLIPSLGLGEFYVLSETENYKLKGCLTDMKHNELYEILKKGYVLNDTKQVEEVEEIEIHEKSQEITN